MTREGKHAGGGRDGCGLITEMVDWLQQGKRRTPEGAIRAIARRRHMAFDDVLDNVCDELGYDRRYWQTRRIVCAICNEIETRQMLHIVKIPGGEAGARNFRIDIKIDWIARVAMGLLARHDSEYFTGGYFARDVGDVLAGRCRKHKSLAATYTKAIASVDHKPEDVADVGRERREVLTAAPDILAMPDEDAPMGFVTLAESLTKRQAAT